MNAVRNFVSEFWRKSIFYVGLQCAPIKLVLEINSRGQAVFYTGRVDNQRAFIIHKMISNFVYRTFENNVLPVFCQGCKLLLQWYLWHILF